MLLMFWFYLLDAQFIEKLHEILFYFLSFHSIPLLHPCLLLLAGTGATVFAAGFIELPREIEHESAAGGVVDGEVAIAEDDGIGLVGIEDVNIAKVGSQRAETTQIEVLL